MSRVLVFAGLGPFLSWLVFVAMLTPELLTRPPFENGLQFFAIALFFCYVFGAPALLIVAMADRLMSGYRGHALFSAALAFAISLSAFYFASRGGVERDFEKHWIFLGLMGAIPAVVCSWLTRGR